MTEPASTLTIDAETAAALIPMGLKAFYAEVRKGTVPVVVVKGRWRFDPADIRAYVATLKTTLKETRKEEHGPCGSTQGKTRRSSTSTSNSPTVVGYEEARARLRNKRR